jgi:hypothetical protein
MGHARGRAGGARGSRRGHVERQQHHRVDAGVDLIEGQVGGPLTLCQENQKTRAQSVLMLTIVQPFMAAFASDFSAPLV